MLIKVIIKNCKWFYRNKRTIKYLHFIIFKENKIFIRGQNIMINLKEGQSVTFTIEALDSKGRPTPVDGVPAIANSNPSAVDVFIDPDGFSGIISWLDGGDAVISATVDADRSAGVREITATADLRTDPAEARTLTIKFGVPTP